MDAAEAKRNADYFNEAQHKHEMDAVMMIISEAARIGAYHADIPRSTTDFVIAKLRGMRYTVEMMGDRYVVKWNRVEDDGEPDKMWPIRPWDKYDVPWRKEGPLPMLSRPYHLREGNIEDVRALS